MDRIPRNLPTESQSLDFEGRKILPLLQSGFYRITEFVPNDYLFLQAATPKLMTAQKPNLIFMQVPDELTRILMYQRGEGDILYNSIQLSKIEWIKKHDLSSWVYSTPGYHLTFLAFHSKSKNTPSLELRSLIRSLLTPAKWAETKWNFWVRPFSFQQAPTEKVSLSPIQPLVFFTTPAREGLENALMIREILQKAGIPIKLKTVDSASFFARVKNGEADLFLNRWMRSSEAEPIFNWLSTNGPRNIYGYSNPNLDAFLNKNPLASFTQVAPYIQKDLPWIPLFQWNHGLVAKRKLGWIEPKPPVLDETFRFLLHLEVKSLSHDSSSR